MAQRDRLQSIMFQSIRDYAAQTGAKFDINDEMRLIGHDSPLDSLGLVIILAAFEAGLNDSFGTDVILADERAMSLEHSPFRTVSTLIDYACTLLEDDGKGS